MKNRLTYLWLTILTLLYFVGWTYTIDTSTPAGTDSPAVIDDRIREAKAGWQERLNVDHYFALTGTQVSDSAVGQHRQVEYYGPISTPTNATNKGWTYTKDVSAKAELHWLDEDGNEKQLTSAGSLNLASAEIVGVLSNDTYFTAVDAAGTGTVNLIKANSSDVPVIPDGTQLASSAAPDDDQDIANKKYVDDVAAGTGFWHTDGSTVFNSTMTASTTWQDLDLSSYVGSNAALVYVEIYATAHTIFFIKPKGYGSSNVMDHYVLYASGMGVIIFNANEYTYMMTSTSSSGICQIAANDNTTIFTIKLIGYIK